MLPLAAGQLIFSAPKVAGKMVSLKADANLSSWKAKRVPAWTLTGESFLKELLWLEPVEAEDRCLLVSRSYSFRGRSMSSRRSKPRHFASVLVGLKGANLLSRGEICWWRMLQVEGGD